MNYTIYILVKGVWTMMSDFTDTDKEIARDFKLWTKKFLDGDHPDIEGVKLEKVPF